MTIKVASNGYGNLGRAVERAVNAADDMEAVAVFTRRDPQSLKTAGTPVFPLSQMADFKGKLTFVFAAEAALQTCAPRDRRPSPTSIR